MESFVAGQILLLDWRGDALPKEPNKLRPCVAVEDTDLFDASYPNVLIVPLTEDVTFGISSLIVKLEPTPENACTKTCYAVSHAITSASKQRIKRITESHITSKQLAEIRSQITESIGA